MADKDEPDDAVKIFEPDRSLHAKIGGTNLDYVLTPQVVKGAQNTITQSSDEFLMESLRQLQEAERLATTMKNAPENSDKYLPWIIDAVFSVKTKAGLGGYDLASELAKSLQIRLEKTRGSKPSEKNLEIIRWHFDSIKNLLAARMKGDGGAVGTAIMAELKRLENDTSL